VSLVPFSGRAIALAAVGVARQSGNEVGERCLFGLAGDCGGENGLAAAFG